MKPRISLIHAVRVAIDPVQEAFRRRWPEGEYVNLLEDALSPDLERAGVLTQAMFDRLFALADYSVSIGASGILFTCSAFGEVIEAVARRVQVPVLKPNEAMFDAALEAGSRIGMLATFPPSVPSMEEEFRRMAAKAGSRATIQTHCVPEALIALKAGDAATHDRLLAEAAPRMRGFDAVLLAHFSTARAEPVVTPLVDAPVYTSPDSAVEKLRSLITAPVPFTHSADLEAR